jgi:pimeloyl-ACP methyl ester carboxylesterase
MARARQTPATEPLAKALYRDHTVIVPDLRGMGLSSQPAGGYDMREVGTNVEGGIITGSGHWIMEEQPAQTVSIRAFLDGKCFLTSTSKCPTARSEQLRDRAFAWLRRR